MVARFRIWWQQIKKHRVPILVIAIILVVVIALIIVGYRFDWTGFNGNNKSGKTLWDWLQLLIIPAVLAVGGFWLSQIQKSREQRTTQQQAELERELTRDNQQETLLQAYIDKMSELLLEKHLRESDPDAEVRKIARVRTLTVFPRLDAIRKRSVLQFLYESGLLDKNKRTINLRGANLSDANLTEIDLHEADLRGANLKGANLDWTNLSGSNLSKADLSKATLIVANLSGADLSGTNLYESNLSEAYLNDTNLNIASLEKANLERTDLSKANLSGAEVTIEQLKQAKSLQGATMPDGSIHP